MKNIVILGGTGMLGSMVVKHLTETSKYAVDYSVRNKDIIDKRAFYFDPLDLATYNNIPDSDYYINCIGIIKPNMFKNMANSVYINAVVPYILAQKFDNVIHITTDCVFSGEDGKYNENSLHDALDEYGKSKSLGEPVNECMVLRTSIIGPEIRNYTSLISWVLQQGEKEINGYTNHFWNGITTLQYAKICEQIIDNNLYQKGLFHIHSPITVNKFELVSKINDHYKVGAEVIPTEAAESIDRTMTSVKPLCKKLRVPEIFEQISEL